MGDSAGFIKVHAICKGQFHLGNASPSKAVVDLHTYIAGL